MVTEVVVSIPGLGDLPGTSMDIDCCRWQALLVELTLPDGKSTLHCLLTPEGIARMGASVRVKGSKWARRRRTVLPPRPLDAADDPDPPTLRDPSPSFQFEEQQGCKTQSAGCLR